MKNDIWNSIFEKYKIIEKIDKNGKFEITSNEINQFREARLMTKFDNASQLPEIFSKNKLSILPITRGKYLIAPMETFYNFPKIEHCSEISYFDFPDNIQSLNPKMISSEVIALNAAYISGILNDFIQDKNLLPTISGKMSSLEFDFNIKNTLKNEDIPISVNKASIEIDAGYEGIETLSIIEAKNHLSDDFIIRQLYYPYRRLLMSNITKNIKTIFMVYTNSIFYLYEYKFEDINNYNSLILNKFRRYSFEKLGIDINDVQKILLNVNLVKEPKIPFPQADSFERVINLCELLDKNKLTKEDITLEYGFDKRQTDYYVNAGKYLNLIIEDENDKKLTLSSNGKDIMEQTTRKRQLSFVQQILSHCVFNAVLKEQFETGEIISISRIVEIMKLHSLFNIRENSTYKRRAHTISSWIEWITSLITYND